MKYLERIKELERDIELLKELNNAITTQLKNHQRSIELINDVLKLITK